MRRAKVLIAWWPRNGMLGGSNSTSASHNHSTSTACFKVTAELPVVVPLRAAGLASAMIAHVEQVDVEGTQQRFPEHPIAIDREAIAMADEKACAVGIGGAAHGDVRTVVHDEGECILRAMGGLIHPAIHPAVTSCSCALRAETPGKPDRRRYERR